MDVKCNQCNWQGNEEQLVPVYKPNPKEQGDVIPVPGCPGCLSDQFLEYGNIVVTKEPPLLSPEELDCLPSVTGYPPTFKDLADFFRQSKRQVAQAQLNADKKWIKENLADA